MKKLSLLFFTIILLFTFTACDASTSESYEKSPLESAALEASKQIGSSESSKAEGGSESGESGGESAENGGLNVIFSGSLVMYNSFAATKDGLYAMTGGKNLLLSYIDFATAQEIVLCSDSACKHDNENCTAYISKEENTPSLFVYGDYLYALCVGYDTEGTFEQKFTNDDEPDEVDTRKKSLYRMNLDGTGREKLFDFPEGDAVEDIVVGEGDNLWFITKKPYIYKKEDGRMYNSSKNRALMKYSLKDRDFTERIPLDEVDNIKLEFIGVFKNKFVFSGTAYPDGKRREDFFDILMPTEHSGPGLTQEQKKKWDALYEKCETVYFTLDRDDKSVAEVYRGDYKTSRGAFGDGYIYLYKPDDTQYRFNIETGESEDVAIPEGYRFDGEIGGRKYYTRITPDWTDEAIYFDDLNGGLTKCDWWSWKCRVEAIGGDTAFIVSDMVGEELSDGSVRNPTSQYAVISLEDLFAGKKTYKNVKMLGE